MSRGIATAGFVVLIVMAGTEVVRAQAAAATDGSPAIAAPHVDPCGGILCGLNPTAMDRPILAEDARRMEAERASHAADAPALSDAKRDRHRRVAYARHGTQAPGRFAAVRTRTPTQRHAETRALVASRPTADGLSWPSRFDRAGDRTVFAPDGYREVDSVTSQPAETQASDELARRTDALSNRGFQALKVDLGRS